MGFLPGLIGAGISLIGGNLANKQAASAQQAQQNYSQGVSKDASQLAQAQQLYQWQQMMQRYQQYINQNPNPANTWSPIQQAGQVGGATVGGGQIGSSGAAGAQMPHHMPSQGTPQQGQQQNIAALMAQMQAGMPQQQQQGPPPAAMPQGSPMNGAAAPAMGGVPLRYLQSLFGGAQ